MKSGVPPSIDSNMTTRGQEKNARGGWGGRGRGGGPERGGGKGIDENSATEGNDRLILSQDEQKALSALEKEREEKQRQQLKAEMRGLLWKTIEWNPVRAAYYHAEPPDGEGRGGLPVAMRATGRERENDADSPARGETTVSWQLGS